MTCLSLRWKSGLVPRANQKQKRDRFAWHYRDKTSGDGGGGGGEVSEDGVVLSADEGERAGTGHSGARTRRRNFGLGQRCVHLFLQNDIPLYG